MGINIIAMTPPPPHNLSIKKIVGDRKVQQVQSITKKKDKDEKNEKKSFQQCLNDELARQSSKKSKPKIDQFR